MIPQTTATIEITVRFFAKAKELANKDVLSLKLPQNASIETLKEKLIQDIPQMSSIATHLHFAIDNQYASDSDFLTNHVEVCCFPPVSGG